MSNFFSRKIFSRSRNGGCDHFFWKICKFFLSLSNPSTFVRACVCVFFCIGPNQNCAMCNTNKHSDMLGLPYVNCNGAFPHSPSAARNAPMRLLLATQPNEIPPLTGAHLPSPQAQARCSAFCVFRVWGMVFPNPSPSQQCSFPPPHPPDSQRPQQHFANPSPPPTPSVSHAPPSVRWRGCLPAGAPGPLVPL